MALGMSGSCNLEMLPQKKHFKRKRFSSWDRTGGNEDWTTIPAGENITLAQTDSIGCIKHIWCTIGKYNSILNCEKHYLRKIILRIFWDESTKPSVEVPIGDFFGMGHGLRKNFVSGPLQMSPENGSSFNCWFPMPFENGFRVEIENECQHALSFFFYIDWEEYENFDQEMFRFHASWNREITEGISHKGLKNLDYQFKGTNTSGKENYVILDTEGEGHFVGCHINIHNQRVFYNWDWPGEGDDMIFVDGEEFPPELHGTGTEDYVNLAFCPTQFYNAPYHGLILGGGINWAGKITYYRYHIADPIPFNKSIKVTIEHGHANRRSDDWSSVAYWYQKSIADIKRLPPLKQRLPLKNKFTLNKVLATTILWPIYKAFISK